MFPYELLGKIFVIVLLTLGLLILIAALVIIFSAKRGPIFMSRVLLAITTTFYGPLKYLFNKLKLDARMVDQFIIALHNARYEEKFNKIDAHEKLVFLPQCLRSIDCPAKITATEGIVCQRCGQCVIGHLKGRLEPLGYRIFVVPGGTFVERIIKTHKPKGVFGVACTANLSDLAMTLSSRGIAIQGEPLLRNGCINTMCDVNRVLSRLSA